MKTNNIVINSIIRKYIKHLCTILILMGMNVSAWGRMGSPYTSTFTTYLTESANQVTVGDITWTISRTTGKGSPTTTFGNQNGQSAIKFGSGANNYYSNITLSTSDFTTYNVTKVVLYISSNNGGSKTITVRQGETTIGSQAQAFSSSDWVTNSTYNTNSGSGGDLTISVASDATATFIHSIEVTYTGGTRHTVTFSAEGGSCGTSSLTEGAVDGGILLPSASPSSACTTGGWAFAGWKQTSALTETTNIPTLYAAGTQYYPRSSETLYAVYKLGDVYTIDFESAEATYDAWTFTNITSQENNSIMPHSGTYYGTTSGQSTASITTASALSSPKRIRFYVSKQTTNTTASYWTVQTSPNGSDWTDRKSQSATSMNPNQWVEVEQDLSSFSDVYIRIFYGTNTAVRNIDDVVLSCATFNSNPTCASCAEDPTLGTLTLTSIANGIITVNCPSISAGENCAINDYGFVWKASSQPTISDNKTQVGTDDRSTAFNSALSISFTTGTTYNIKAYATNGHGTALSTTLAVTPQSVTFNSNDGSTVATQYVNNGGTVSAPSDPTKSGFVFGGWFQESGLSTPVDWSAAITADKTYYAKWLRYSDYVFTCAELTLEPHLVTTGTPIFITSSASKKVRSQDYIQIIGSGLTPSTTLTFPGLPSTFEIKTATYGDLATDGDGAIDAAAYIFYTPAADATSDGLDKITGITVTVGGAKTKTVSLTQDIIGRHLPADFVIAGKKDGKWYALPDTMTMTTHPTPIEIAVDDANNPSVAYTAATNIYNLYGQNSGAGYLEEAGQYVKLGMKNNSTFANYPLLGTALTAIGKSTGTDPTHNLDQQYWWLFTQTNTSISNPQDAKYIVHCANNSSSLSIKNDPFQWGLYASGVEELRLIPASSVVFTEAEIVAWGQHNAIVEVDKANAGGTGVAAEKVKALLNGAESSLITLAETKTSNGTGATKYDYTVAFGDVIDFAANEGQMLTLEWYNSSDVMIAVSNIIVPRVIATTNTMYTISTNDPGWNTEVHVLPGVTLTADAGYFPSSDVSIKELNIYPGATVNVTTGTLKATTLVMRNGWDRLNGDKKYDVARLFITPTTGSLQAGTAYSDWYIDFDQYYPIAVPWEVDLGGNDGSTLKYKNTKSNAIIGATTGSVRLRYYDGASRASNGQTNIGNSPNWKLYGADGSEAIPAKLQPGKGYAMTAKRPTGKAFSIIRMPLTLPSGTWSEGTWTTNGESGSVSTTTHKDQVSVTAHGNDNTPAYAKGWNFIANPYMSLYGGTIEYSDATKVNFVNIPDVDFKEFGQYATATTKLKPASGFLIQAPKDGTLTFGTSNRAAAAPSYRNATKEVAKEQQAYILLANDAAEDMMGLLVSEKYTAEYEMNADLEKLLSDGNTLRTYMRYNDMNMAYLAINEELAKQLIPVSVRIPADGDYTFRIHEASIADELEGIYLTDYQTNIVTNLLYDSYTFNAVAGTDNARFAINAVIGKREVPTGVDISGSDKDRPTKFIWNDKVYILHNNVIYDSTGKRVNVINK